MENPDLKLTDVQEKDMASIREATAFLRRYGWESVQVFCTRKAPGRDSWINANYGEGNYFARYGQVRMWMLQEEADRPGQYRYGP